MAPNNRIAVIIPTKERKFELRRLLSSFVSQRSIPDQIIIIDDSDEADFLLVEDFKRLSVTYIHGNYSMTEARNVGVANLEEDIALVCFLDDDVVMEEEAWEAMTDFWENADLDVGGCSFFISNEVQYDKLLIKAFKKIFNIKPQECGKVLPSGFNVTPYSPLEETIYTDWLSGGVTIWRRIVFDTNSFDEWFSGYGMYEDVDFSYRVGKKFKLVVNSDAKVRHLMDISKSGMNFKIGKKEVINRLYFVKKHQELSAKLSLWSNVGGTIRNFSSGLILFNMGHIIRAFGNLIGILNYIIYKDEVFYRKIGKPLEEVVPVCLPESKAPLKSVAILGCSGFIGSHLIQSIGSLGKIKLHALSHNKEINYLDSLLHVNFRLIKGDIFDRDALLKVIEPGATVVNLVRLNSVSSREKIMAGECLASVCTERKVRRLIHCSTANVVGNSSDRQVSENTPCYPSGINNRTYLDMERVLRSQANGQFEIVVLRPTIVFGKGGLNLNMMINDLRSKHWFYNYFKSCLFNRRCMNLVGIENVVNALLFLMETDQLINQKVFYISDDEDPNNNYWYIEKRIIELMNLNDYPLPRIPIPKVLLELALIISGRTIYRTRRECDWKSLNKIGYRKKTSFTNALELFISEFDKTQSFPLHFDPARNNNQK